MDQMGRMSVYLFKRFRSFNPVNIGSVGQRAAKLLSIKLWEWFNPKIQEASSISRVGFVLSKWPHLHRARLVSVCNRTFVAVYISNPLCIALLIWFLNITYVISGGNHNKVLQNKRMNFLRKHDYFLTVCPIVVMPAILQCQYSMFQKFMTIVIRELIKTQ